MIHLTSLCSDLKGIYSAIAEAREVKDKPSIIRLRTTIGFGSKQQGTHGVHGSRMNSTPSHLLMPDGRLM